MTASFDGKIDTSTLEAIEREVKSMAGDAKGLYDSARRDLEQLRKLVDDGRGYTDATTRALGELTSTKFSALEKNANEKIAALEKAVEDQAVLAKRQTRSAGDGEQKANGEAIEFKRSLLSIQDRSHRAEEIEDADVGEYQSYCKAFRGAMRRDARLLTGDEYKLLSASSDPNGGFLVPTAMSQRILTLVRESSPMRQLATIENIGTDSLELPIDEADVTYGWVGEQEARTETTTPTVGVQGIPVNEMYAEPRATQKLIEDASINVEAWLAGKVGDRFARAEATAFITGSGVKRPRGILTYTAGTINTYARGSIQQIPSGAAATLLPDVFVKTPTYLKEVYQGGARWLMKRVTLADIQVMKDGAGQYLWQPGLRDGIPSSLAGYPISLADDMPAVAAGALSVAFGNFRQAYTIVDRLGITTIRDALTSKPFIKFYSRRRVGGDVTNFDAVIIVRVAAS